jgi:hypothetical protein
VKAPLLASQPPPGDPNATTYKGKENGLYIWLFLPEATLLPSSQEK